MSAFVKVVPVYPKQIAIQTEKGLSHHTPDKERHLLEAVIEKEVLSRNLPGYIDLNGTFNRVER